MGAALAARPHRARGTSAKPVDLALAGLGRLLGGTRAALLAALTNPATTSGFADRCQVPLSAVSDHLAALGAAGLITAHRVGHAVQYQRTDLGDALLSAAAAET